MKNILLYYYFVRFIPEVPMNKVHVGSAPSPNIKAVKSKIGSLDNATHKPGGGNIKIENKKLDFTKTTPRIAAKNDAYAPSGGDKKVCKTLVHKDSAANLLKISYATCKT